MTPQSDIAKKCRMLPAITKGQIYLLHALHPKLSRIHDIRMASEDLWEFEVLLGVGTASQRVIMWLSIDGLMIANVTDEYRGDPRTDERKIGVARMFPNWNHFFGSDAGMIEQTHDAGYMALGRDYPHNLYNKAKEWAIDVVDNRAYDRWPTDHFGRTWNEIEFPREEMCSVCGQPDNCGDCNHEKLTNEEAESLRG